MYEYIYLILTKHCKEGIDVMLSLINGETESQRVYLPQGNAAGKWQSQGLNLASRVFTIQYTDSYFLYHLTF